MKLTPLAIAFGLSTALLAAPQPARADTDAEELPAPPPPRLHEPPNVALAVAFPVTATGWPPGGVFAGLELSTMLRLKAGSMLGASFAFARSLAPPIGTQYQFVPKVHRITDVAFDLRYEGRFRIPDAVAPWISLGTGPFLRVAEGTGGSETRARRIGWDIVRVEGGVDTRTEPLSIGLFGQIRMSAVSECGGGLFWGDSELSYLNDCPESVRAAVWIGGGLRVVLSGD